MSDKNELMVKAEQVLINMIDKAAEIGSAAVDEIPLVVQELIMYNFVVELTVFLLTVITITTVVLLNVKYFNRVKEESFDAAGGMVTMSFIICFVLFLVAICHMDWLKIWLAPRVYLLEYAASLVK